MFKKIVILVILIPAALLSYGAPAAAVDPFRDLAAVSALLAEADTEEILFEQNISRRHPADALTKVMTLLIAVTAIENGEAFENMRVEMTETAWFDITSRDGTQNIKPGEEMTLLDLMYSAYVGRASEACNMIAEHIAGSVEEFVRLMNQRAVELGCVTTNFTNTHGQYNDDQYTSARDMFLIFRDAVSRPLFAEINSVYRYTVEATGMSDSRRLINPNSMLNSSSSKYYFRHCTSGIPSVTFEGGNSFVGSAEADGLTLIVVVLGSDEIMLEDESYDMRNLTESRRLFEWGFSEFGWHTILSSSELVDKAPIQHGAGADFVNLRPESSITLLIANDIPYEEFERKITIYSIENDEPLTAPIDAGDVLGEILLTRNGLEYGPILLVANTSIELHRFEFIRMQVMDLLSSTVARYVIWALVILVAGYVALVIRYNVIRRKRHNRITQAKKQLAEERRNSAESEREQRWR